MKFRRTVEIEKGKLEMTPLIDVILLLLIFFMLTSSFVFNPGIKVNLPTYSTDESMQPTDMVVTITKSEDIFFQGDIISPIDDFIELRLRFKKAAAEVEDARLVVKADAGVPCGRVFEIMAMARDEGFETLDVATKEKEPEILE